MTTFILETVHSIDNRRYTNHLLPRRLWSAADPGSGCGSSESGSRVSVIQGQKHIAMYTAPDLFMKEVVRFFLETQIPPVC